MDASFPISPPRQLLVDIKKAARALRSRANTWQARLDLCAGLLGDHPDPGLLEVASDLQRLDSEERHYWIGSLYALLLQDKVRRDQATYFTPPSLARGVLDLARKCGFDDGIHTVVDPAAGGAAFLSTVAGLMTQKSAAASIVSRLRGFEIDPGLAALSQLLLNDRLGLTLSEDVIQTADALHLRVKDKFDLVVANPPFGRLSADQAKLVDWQDVCHPGHINKYALFVKLCISLVKPSGVVALVLPSSFLAGPLYGKLRSFIRQNSEVKFIASVAERQDVFIDVAQDVSVLVLRAGKPRETRPVSHGRFGPFGSFSTTSEAVLPTRIEQPWTLPTGSGTLHVGGHKIADYGIAVRAGYFVWNREQERMRRRRSSARDFPLVWARNIKAGRYCTPASRSGGSPDFVHFEDSSSGVTKGPALVMQRTTNSTQVRRLVVARVKPSDIAKWGGFVAENHVIVLSGASPTVLNDMCFLLNSVAVDLRYRQVSGTASVSVTLLRELDLPSPEALVTALRRHGRTEEAVNIAYATSLQREAER